MNKNISKSLAELLKCFPLIEPPVTISGEVAPSFSAKNPPIPTKYIAQYFAEWENLDEYTEIVPCFQLQSPGNHSIIVYWKGGLLSYEFILASLAPNAELITKKVIAGTVSNNKTIKESVAVISEDLTVYTVVGESDVKSRVYKPENSQSFRFEILPDGTIPSIQEDKSTWEEENMERKN